MPPRGKTLLFALFFLFVLGAGLPATAGTHFAGGVQVDGGDDDGAGGYDELPLNYGDMSRYDQIAMEPYSETYDALPVEEKAQLYGKQFEYMRGRRPNFDPAIFNPPAGKKAGERGDAAYGETGERRTADGAGVDDAGYDPLPMWFDDMGKYDQIAMEPYRDRYDAMPVGEKARVYGPQFEFMRGRKANFHPDVVAQMDEFEASETIDGPVSSFQAKQYLYKPAEPKKRRPGISASQEEILGALSGPWEKAPAAGEDAGGTDRKAAPQPARRSRPDRRMETLREGWNAADVLRGARER